MIPAKAKRKNVDKDHCGEKNHQKIFSCRRPKNLIIFVCAHAFPTATVDNFVDYWPRCRRDQPGMRVPANRLTMRQKNSRDIGRFHKLKILGIGTARLKNKESEVKLFLIVVPLRRAVKVIPRS